MTAAPGDGVSDETGVPGGADAPGGAEDSGEASTRQRVERTGRRRARLTPAPNTDTSPEKVVRDEPPAGGTPDDDRITRERPPHW